MPLAFGVRSIVSSPTCRFAGLSRAGDDSVRVDPPAGGGGSSAEVAMETVDDVV